MKFKIMSQIFLIFTLLVSIAGCTYSSGPNDLGRNHSKPSSIPSYIDKLTSSRKSHYFYAHILLRNLFFSNPQYFIEKIHTEKEGYLRRILNDLQKHEFKKINPNKIHVEKIINKKNNKLYIIDLPEPKRATEAYYIVLSLKENKPRFFTLEKTTDIKKTGIKAVICEWKFENGQISHENYGISIKKTSKKTFLRILPSLLKNTFLRPSAGFGVTQDGQIYLKINPNRGRETVDKLEKIFIKGVKALDVYDFRAGLFELEQGLKHSEELKYLYYIGKFSSSIGYLYEQLGKYNKAVFYYKKAIKNSDEAGDYKGTSNSLNLLTNIFRIGNQEQLALEQYNEILILYQGVGNRRGESEIFNDIGNVYANIEKYAKAQEAYEKALAIAHELNDLNMERIILFGVAMLYEKQGKSLKSQEHLLRTLFLFKYNDLKNLWQVWYGLHRVTKKLNNPNAAIFYGKQAVNTIQQLRSHVAQLDDKSLHQSFLKYKKHVYEDLADLLMRQGRLFEAQKVLDLLKQEEYFDFIRRTRAEELPSDGLRFTPPEQPWFERYQAIAKQLVTLGEAYALLGEKKKRGLSLSSQEQQRLEQLTVDLSIAEQALQAWFKNTNTALGNLKAEDMQAALNAFDDKREQLRGLLKDLGKGTVLVYFVPFAERLDILISTAEVTVRREVAVKREDLGKAVLALREALKQAGRKRGWDMPTASNNMAAPMDLTVVQSAAKPLYDWLIAPIAADLRRAEAEVLMVYLAGEMRYLPLAALHSGKGWLAEDYALAMYTAAADMHLKTEPQTQWKVAGLGVSGKHEGFAPLPAVKTELESIVRRGAQDKDGILPGEIHLDADFTENTLSDVLLRDFPVLHIASHFSLQVGKDTDSFLLLGDGSHLSLADFATKRFDWQGLDMLALSACNTGMGINTGDGTEVEGLGTLVVKRGAKSVLASLWPVSDQSTAEFMRQLYSVEAASPISKAKAIQKVQQAFIAAKQSDLPDYYRHPFHWSAFILMGNWL